MCFPALPNLKGFVFIVTYGRSGSTLLQTIMNSFENTCMRGENYLAIASLYECWDRINKAQKNHGRSYGKHNQPWHGVDLVDMDELGKNLANTFIHSVLKPSINTEWIGFKEIRYNNMGARFDGLIDFVFEFFPNLKIIYNLRDLNEVSNSGWFRKRDPLIVKKNLEAAEMRFLSAAKRYEENSLVVSYNNLIANPAECKKLAEFLDVPFDPNKVTNILNRKLTH